MRPSWSEKPVTDHVRATYSAEPWREGLRSNSIVADTLAFDSVHGSGDFSAYGGYLVAESIGQSNRRRIIACVNACKGLDTEWLEEILSKGRTINDECRILIEALAHEPSRDEMNDMHEPEDKLGIENVKLSKQLAYTLAERDNAWQELRDIREVIDADPEESTLDEVRRVVAQHKNTIEANGIISNMLFGDRDYRLPCDVTLPPATTIRKGVPVKVLLTAFRVREKVSSEQRFIDRVIDPEMIDHLVRKSIPKRARCPVCESGVGAILPHGAECAVCKGTGRLHVFSARQLKLLPFYTAEEVAEFARTEREEPYQETHCGFPGGMNKP